MRRFALSLLAAVAVADAATAQAVALRKPGGWVSAKGTTVESYSVDVGAKWELGEASGAVTSGLQQFGREGDPALWSRLKIEDGEAGLRWAGEAPQVDVNWNWKLGVGLMPHRHFFSLSPRLDWAPEGEALALRSEAVLEGLPRTSLSVEQLRDGTKKAWIGVTTRVSDDFGLRLEASGDERSDVPQVRVQLVR